MRLKGLMGAKY